MEKSAEGVQRAAPVVMRAWPRFLWNQLLQPTLRKRYRKAMYQLLLLHPMRPSHSIAALQSAIIRAAPASAVSIIDQKKKRANKRKQSLRYVRG